MNNETIFSERQRFTRKWIWILLLFVYAILLYGFIQQVFFGVPFGNRPVGNTAFVIYNICFVLMGVLFRMTRLDTEIREEGIYYQLFPFQFKMRKISIDEIEKIYVREYNPIMEYGGWGLRLGLFGKGWAVNVAGNKGIQIIFKDSKRRKFLIGTQKPEEAEAALKSIFQNRKI